MADVRPFRALRFDAAAVDLSRTIAPPYDVISPAEQQSLYDRSPHNIVRIEYGQQSPDDTASDSRYTRAAADLQSWRADGALIREDAPRIYSYQQEFSWDGMRHTRRHYFAAVRLEEWEKGVVKPHEHTLSGPKADRLDLLRATRTQVSPVYCLYRAKGSTPPLRDIVGEPLYDVEADGQRHILSSISDPDQLAAVTAHLANGDVYIADGHHRYETALRYRDECRDRADRWTGDEPENFVLMALTDASDPGLLVLPTHRLLTTTTSPSDALTQIARYFQIDEIDVASAEGRRNALHRLDASKHKTAFLALGLAPERAHLLTLEDRTAIEALMPSDQPKAWKRLDVSVLQYGVLDHVFGIDDAALARGGSISYTQDPGIAFDAVARGEVRGAFLLNATPVNQVLAVADVGGRMPQKSTYFYPKLPTGLVMNALDGG